MRPFLLLSLSLSQVALAQTADFPTKQELELLTRKLEPESISVDARRFLKTKMKGHAKDMKDLSIAVATVNFAGAAKAAQLIANQPRLDPATAPALSLPSSFFSMQDLLRRSAQGLADSAKEANFERTVEHYQYVVAVCAVCHVAFIPATASQAK